MDESTKELKIIRIQGEIRDLNGQYSPLKAKQKRQITGLIQGGIPLILLGILNWVSFTSSSTSSSSRSLSIPFLEIMSTLFVTIVVIVYFILLITVISRRKKIKALESAINKRYAYVRKLKESLL